MAAMANVRESRLRTGATQWGLFRNGEHPGEFEEIFVVASWDEHLRQHTERMTATDFAYEAEAKALSATTPQTWHLLPTHLGERWGRLTPDHGKPSGARAAQIVIGPGQTDPVTSHRPACRGGSPRLVTFDHSLRLPLRHRAHSRDALAAYRAGESGMSEGEHPAVTGHFPVPPGAMRWPCRQPAGWWVPPIDP